MKKMYLFFFISSILFSKLHSADALTFLQIYQSDAKEWFDKSVRSLNRNNRSNLLQFMMSDFTLKNINSESELKTIAKRVCEKNFEELKKNSDALNAWNSVLEYTQNYDYPEYTKIFCDYLFQNMKS